MRNLPRKIKQNRMKKKKRMETTVRGIQTADQNRMTKQTAKNIFYSATF